MVGRCGMMNERMEKILAKAKSKVWHTGGGLLNEKAFEIVTMLIIQECVALVNSLDGYEGTDDSPNVSYIKKYFGIEVK